MPARDYENEMTKLHPDFIFLSGTRERGQRETRTNHFKNSVDVRLCREAEDNCHNYWTMGGIRKDFLLLGINEGNERKMW